MFTEWECVLVNTLEMTQSVYITYENAKKETSFSWNHGFDLCDNQGNIHIHGRGKCAEDFCLIVSLPRLFWESVY